MPKKTQRMVYARGQSVFELIDLDGHIYVLQAHDAQFPIESLAKLEQMKQLRSAWSGNIRFNQAIVFPNIESQPEKKNAILI